MMPQVRLEPGTTRLKVSEIILHYYIPEFYANDTHDLCTKYLPCIN